MTTAAGGAGAAHDATIKTSKRTEADRLTEKVEKLRAHLAAAEATLAEVKKGHS